jgi:hypothetical protein
MKLLYSAWGCCSSMRVRFPTGAHPTSYPMGTRAVGTELKWPGRESDHSSPFSAEVKNEWSYTFTPLIRCMA